MPEAEIKYFLSYVRADSEFVLKLSKELRAAGANLWVDQLDILGGEHWDRTVEKALKACQGMIAVLSPESVESKNVMDEVSYALEEGKLVVPVLFRPCDIPFRLRRVQHIDFTTDYDTGFSRLLRALHIEAQRRVAAPQKPEAGAARKIEAPPERPQVEPRRWEDKKKVPTVSLPSYFKAFGFHLLLGFGLFYVDNRLPRRWVHLVPPFYAVIDLILAAGFGLEPFRSEFGGWSFIIALILYGLSFIDVGITCRNRRKIDGTAQ